jgi:hypothetical protein
MTGDVPVPILMSCSEKDNELQRSASYLFPISQFVSALQAGEPIIE